MSWVELLGAAVGIGLVAGMRLYATVLMLGAAIHFGWIAISPGQEQWSILAHPAVISVAGIAFLVEFIADKIPWVDSIWDSFHTIIRPVGAAVLGATMIGTANPVFQTVIAILCGGIALTSHSSKAASRLLVNQSPEPVSNFFVSLIEDAMVPLGLWLAISHPLVMIVLFLVFLALFIWMVPKIFRLMKQLAVTVYSRLKGNKPADAMMRPQS